VKRRAQLFPPGVPISKRVLDYVITLPGFVILSPLLLLIALLVWTLHGRPVFFCQDRPGYRGEPFRLCKFRTMRNERDGAGNLLPDELRLTSFGRFLRSFSLDELPELLNVLSGEMSLVGPRPLLMQYLERYSPEQARRHDVLPGITGWAQIKGRNELSWPVKFKLDVWYVDNWSFGLDCRILIETVVAVIKREGISQQGHATAPEFMGDEDSSS